MKLPVLSVLALLLVACQSVRDAPVAATPIQAVLAKAKDDQRVVIRGQVVSRVDEETYVVGDNTGRIRVQIDDDAARRAAIGIGTHLEVAGEVDTNVFRDPTIEAERITVLQPVPAAMSGTAPPPAYR